MARSTKKLIINLKVEYAPCPADKEGAYRAGLRLLLKLLYEERDRLEQERANESAASKYQSDLCAPSPEDG